MAGMNVIAILSRWVHCQCFCWKAVCRDWRSCPALSAASTCRFKQQLDAWKSQVAAEFVPAELMEHFKTDTESDREKWMNKAELESMSLICSANSENTQR